MSKTKCDGNKHKHIIPQSSGVSKLFSRIKKINKNKFQELNFSVV